MVPPEVVRSLQLSIIDHSELPLKYLCGRIQQCAVVKYILLTKNHRKTEYPKNSCKATP